METENPVRINIASSAAQAVDSICSDEIALQPVVHCSEIANFCSSTIECTCSQESLLGTSRTAVEWAALNICAFNVFAAEIRNSSDTATTFTSLQSSPEIGLLTR